MLQRTVYLMGAGVIGLREVLQAQLQAEIAELRGFIRQAKTWADTVEARANPPRTMPLRSFLD